MLLTAAVLPLHKEVQLTLGDISQFLDALLAWVLDKADTELTKTSALQMLCSIVNRQSNGKWEFVRSFTNLMLITVYIELSSFLNDKLDVFWVKGIQDGNLPVERRIWSIKSWTWVLFSSRTDVSSGSELSFPVRYQKHYLYGSIR